MFKISGKVTKNVRVWEIESSKLPQNYKCDTHTSKGIWTGWECPVPTPLSHDLTTTDLPFCFVFTTPWVSEIFHMARSMT
jgi:hypothetical protein